MKNRLIEIRNQLKEQCLDATIVSSLSNLEYLTGFFGFSKEERDAYLLITKTHAYIFTNALYSEAVYQQVPHFTLVEITSSSPLTDLLKKLSVKHDLKKVGIEEDNITLSEYKKIAGCFQRLTNVNLKDLRVKKATEEIIAIKNACKISDKTFLHILKKLKSGVTEQEISFELEIFMKKNGADISFQPIIAFGKNASIPHHKSGNLKLKTENIVLLDFGARYNNYCSDMTRTVFFGKATDEQKSMYQVALDTQQNAINYLSKALSKHYSSSEGAKRLSREVIQDTQNNNSSRLANARSNNIKASDVDKVARDHIISQGYPTIPHSLGHGIGLQVHEAPSLSPNSKDVLEEGMVFSIEPGIYMKGAGGIRIEDLFTIQNGKLLQLTQSPKNLVEL